MDKYYTTMEDLQVIISSMGAVLKYGDHIILTDSNCYGLYRAEVYKFVDSWKEKNIEARLELLEKEPGFDDAGHAVDWAIKRIQCL